ncbi:hypothetical protein Daus18300_002211 [Diaporthe australafricana]|uniref:Uncharacterized protein n=1 Tax=Diaporthe australafricana TaxID=127596 RepID=A0ABR3XRS0_9PEZI
MREYENDAKQKYKTGVDVDDAHSVDQLWQVIDNAIEDYTSKDRDGVWGKIRMGFRKLGDGSEAMQGWLGLLPTESEYMSVVCGGLKLILKAASQLRRVADTVLNELHRIPAILSSVQRVLNIYRDSTKLVELSDAIYQSVLVSLGRMLEYLRHNACRKVTKAFFKQQSFQSDLLMKIEDIAVARDDFNTEAELCHKEAVQKLQEATERGGDRVENGISDLSQVVTIARKEQERSNQKIQEYFELVGHSYFELTKEIREMKRRQELSILATNYLLEVLRSNPRVIEAAYNEAHPSQARKKLLLQLDYDREIVGQDVVSNYQLGLALTRDEQERCLHVIKSPALARWVRSERSSALVINGHSSGVIKRKSGLSFLCARLIYGLDKIRFGDEPGSSTVVRREIVPIHFFCGQHLHNDHSESWESPSGVINSLLVQLISQCPDIDPSRSATSRISDIENSDVCDVFEFFRLSIRQLPSNFIVYCIVDAMSFYTNNDQVSKPAWRLLKGLLKLTRTSKNESKSRAVFKLLLTAPSRLRTEELDALDDEQVLNVPKTLPNTGGFTAMKWDTSMGQQLEEV